MPEGSSFIDSDKIAMFIYTRLALEAMCQTIYISSVGENVTHERFCDKAGHPGHSEVFVDGEWRPKV